MVQCAFSVDATNMHWIKGCQDFIQDFLPRGKLDYNYVFLSGKALTALRHICSMEHSTLNLLNSVYTKWVPRPLTAIIIVSISEGRHINLRSSIFDHRPSTFDHRSSIIDLRPSIIDLRPSTIDLRPSIIDHRPSIFDHRSSIFASTFNHRPSIFNHRSSHRSSTIDLRTSIFEHRSSKIEGRNIAPTIQHRTDNSSPNIVHNGTPYRWRSYV